MQPTCSRFTDAPTAAARARVAARYPLQLGVILLALAATVPMQRAFASPEDVDQQTKLALHLDANPARGAAKFRQYCTRCHGPAAHGDEARVIPSLAGQRFSYLVRQLANISGDERDSVTMHRVLSSNDLKQPQTWVDIASYLSSAPVLPAAKGGHEDRQGTGEAIFQRQCASCHHDDARGDDDGFVPSLRNQHYSYLVAQVQQMSKYSRHNVDEDLVQFFKSLESEELSDVAAYLSHLNGPVKDRTVMRDNGVVVD